MDIKKILIVVVGAILFNSCNPKENQSIQVLSLDSFEKRLNELPDKIILDVRTPEEYQDAHIKNATLRDIYDPDFKEKVNNLDKSKPIFVYCASGIRSEKAANILSQLGFKKIYHMEGGLKQWISADKPVQTN
ncbi:MAG: rhodanese-like domain-containing protein [Cyclobacteriaceae bacterium]